MKTPPPLPASSVTPLPSTPAGGPARNAAICSLLAPVFSIFIAIGVQPQVHGNRLAMIILGVLQMSLILLGFVSGIWAWRRTKRVGRQGIYGKAVCGTCVNGLLILLLLLSIPGLHRAMARAKREQARRTQSLTDARQGFETKLTRKLSLGEPAPVPPSERFRLVKYPSPAGEMSAYITPAPGDGKKHPAILWVFGGFGNSIGEIAWEPGRPENDQSGSAFQRPGLIVMYPSLRGGNDNPGSMEGFFGEVDDIIAAADYLARQDYVDPRRVYLGGHSTGGTLALLVAESTDRFRAVFSFGPVRNVVGYGAEHLPFDVRESREVELRAPVLWLHSVRMPTFVFEGMEQPSNIVELRGLQRAAQNPMLQFCPVEGVSHFSILAPVSRLIAQKILADAGGAGVTFSNNELRNCVRQARNSEQR